jgi:hypothetical protein
MTTTIKRICPSCGQQFEARKASSVYCDLDCYMASQPPPSEFSILPSEERRRNAARSNIVNLADALMKALAERKR